MRRFKQAENFNGYKDLDSSEDLVINNLMDIEFAIVEDSLYIMYLQYGRVHCVDGPAFIYYEDARKVKVKFIQFWLNNYMVNQENWFRSISKENRIKYLFNLEKYQ